MNKEVIYIVIAFIAILCVMSSGCIAPNNSTLDEKKYDKLVIDYKMVDTIKGDQTLIQKTYDFSYLGKQWNIVAQVPKYRYDNYVQEKYLVCKEKDLDYEPTYQRAFVYDEYVMNLVEQFKAQNGDLSTQELIKVLTYFVQSQIIYVDDEEQYAREYIAYPMQTLINGKGDCDCIAILLTSLYMHLGYDSICVSILPIGYSYGHILVGINYINVDIDAKSIDYKGKQYYLVESVGVNPIGIGTFINEDVDKWREVHAKGYKTIYSNGDIVSQKEYANRQHLFKDTSYSKKQL